MELEELERAAGLDPDSPDYRLRQQLAEADDQLIEHLVQLRKDKGLTQRVVAERMKRDVAAVSNFERLRADPHLSTIRRYAAAIGASITHQVVDIDNALNADSSVQNAANDSITAEERQTLFRLLEKMASGHDGQFLTQRPGAWSGYKISVQWGEASDAPAEMCLSFLVDGRAQVGTSRR